MLSLNPGLTSNLILEQEETFSEKMNAKRKIKNDYGVNWNKVQGYFENCIPKKIKDKLSHLLN